MYVVGMHCNEISNVNSGTSIGLYIPMLVPQLTLDCNWDYQLNNQKSPFLSIS